MISANPGDLLQLFVLQMLPQNVFFPKDAAAAKDALPLLGGVVQILFRNIRRHWMIDLRPVIVIGPHFSNLVLMVERKVRMKRKKQTDDATAAHFS